MTPEEIHLGRVARLGCWICGSPANCHHIRDGQGMGQKASDFETIPLCHNHHQGPEGIHTLGTRVWQARFGLEVEILAAVRKELVRLYGEVRMPSDDKADRIRRKNARFKKLIKPS